MPPPLITMFAAKTITTNPSPAKNNPQANFATLDGSFPRLPRAIQTAAKTGAGMDVDAARVAKREPGMNRIEVLTSESQERMLAIVTPENLDEVLAVCERWEVRATVAGRVTDSGRFRVFDVGRLAVEKVVAAL